MISQLDTMIGQFEDDKDVKCWSSFKQLETFVAGCQLSPQTTHLKTEVVINYLDQIWKLADNAGSAGPDPIDVKTFDTVAGKIFANEVLRDASFEFKLQERILIIPNQDIDNYLGTVEPLRVLRLMARRVSEREPGRPGLSSDAVISASRFAAILSTAVLKDANLAARRNQHRLIEDSDVNEVDQNMSKALGLKPIDRASLGARPPESTATPADRLGEMLSIIRRKIRSLATFNANYTKEKLDYSFDPDLARNEQEWAGMPVDQEDSRHFKIEVLAKHATFLLTECARQHPQSNPLRGPEMLDTILAFYPFVTVYEGVTHIFPDNQPMHVYEFEADALRDSAWHWRALENALIKLDSEGQRIPETDLYAMEELTEFLSVYAVGSIRLSGELASLSGNQKVTATNLKQAHELFKKRSQHHRTTKATSSSESDQSQKSEFAAHGQQARQNVRAAYIEEIFSDVTADSGIDFQHNCSQMVTDYRFDGKNAKKGYLKAMRGLLDKPLTADRKIPVLEVGIAGGGVAVEDVDGDGLLDIYLVNGHGDKLYRNLGGLRFKDASEASGLSKDDQGEGRGAYFADYDNDGDQDLLVTHVHAPNRLLRNNGKGKLKDVTEEVGLPLRTDLVSHSAVWLDFDNDGDLDIYIGNFGDWLTGERPHIGNSRNGQANLLYRNNGSRGFEDITAESGAGDVGWTHAVSHFDLNRDGFQDLYLANDFGEDVLLVNNEGQGFTPAEPPGVNQHYFHGMSVSFTDINSDGIEDIYISNIAMFTFVSKYVKPNEETSLSLTKRTTQNTRMLENNMFMVSNTKGFTDEHHKYFERSIDGCGWAWDADFFDFDNDGRDDIYILNGREPNLRYDHERNVLYKGHAGRFYDVSQSSGADFKSNSRGAVHADFDNDGDLDIIINNFEAPAILLRNNLQRNNWVRFRLIGKETNRDAIGAQIIVETSKGGRQVRTVRGGSGFLSKEPNALHFGLGQADTVERAEIRWPGGKTQTISIASVNRQYDVTESSAEKTPQPTSR